MEQKIDLLVNDVQYLRTKLNWACKALATFQAAAGEVHTEKVVELDPSTEKQTQSKLNSYLTGALGYRGVDQAGRTPDALMEHLTAEFSFDFDPCPENPGFDGLSIEWGATNYVNPPYNDIAPWVTKALAERDRIGATSVFLVPFRPHTKYFRDLILPNACEIRFFRHKFAFKGYKQATLAVAITIFRPVSPEIPQQLTSELDRRFNLLQLRDIGGGFTAANIIRIFSGYFPVEQMLQDSSNVNEVDENSNCLIITNFKPLAFIERAETLFNLHGKTIILTIPFRIESSYFMNKIMFGTATHVLAVNPTICMDGFTNRSPTGSVALIWTRTPKQDLYRNNGFQMTIIEENFHQRAS